MGMQEKVVDIGTQSCITLQNSDVALEHAVLPSEECSIICSTASAVQHAAWLAEHDVLMF